MNRRLSMCRSSVLSLGRQMMGAEVRGSRRIARATGALYLAYFAVSVLSEGLGRLTTGDAMTIIANATAHPGRFRVAFVAGLGCALVFACAAWALHVLLRPVGAREARLFLVLNLVGVAVQSLSTLLLAAAWLVPRDANALGDPDALMRVFVELYRSGYVAAQLFFGAWLFPLG